MLRSLIKKIFGKLSQTYFYRRRRLALVFRHISIFCSIPNIWKPKTVNEIVLKKLLFDRDPKLTLFADKIKVRDLAKQKESPLEIVYKFQCQIISTLFLPSLTLK